LVYFPFISNLCQDKNLPVISEYHSILLYAISDCKSILSWHIFVIHYIVCIVILYYFNFTEQLSWSDRNLVWFTNISYQDTFLSKRSYAFSKRTVTSSKQSYTQTECMLQEKWLCQNKVTQYITITYSKCKTILHYDIWETLHNICVTIHK